MCTASLELRGQDVAVVSSRLEYYQSGFLESAPRMVPLPRAVATAKVFWGFRPFSLAGENASALGRT